MAQKQEVDIICKLALKPFSQHTLTEKKLLLSDGRPTPNINLTKVNAHFTRKFNSMLYSTVSWLCASHTANKLYCWPCLCFSSENTAWSKANKGYNDLNNISTAISRHEKSLSHIQAYFDLKTFEISSQDTTMIDKLVELRIKKHNDYVSKNREILKRFISITCFLVMQGLPFSIENESESSNNRGNYAELAYLFAEFDEQLENHLNDSTVFKGLSKTIQNYLVDSISTVLLNEIRNELAKCEYVTILLYETSDVGYVSQLSTVVRYLDEAGSTCERFLGFTTNVSKGRTAADISTLVIKTLDELGCTKKLVAQSYDGAAVMANELDDVVMKVKEAAPKAIFMHSFTHHKLDLILSEAVLHIPMCNTFFSVFNSLSSFFSKSTKLTTLLNEDVQKHFPNIVPINWKHFETVIEIKENLKNLFSYIQENPTKFDDKTKNDARGFSVAFDSFDFNFLIKVFSPIFHLLKYLLKILKAKLIDMFLWNTVEKTIEKLEDMNETKFDDIWNEVVVDVGFPSLRKRGDIPIKEIYRQVFTEIFHNIIGQLKERFKSVKDLEFLELLNCKNYSRDQETFPDSAYKSLENNYNSFFEFPRLKSELTVLFSCISYPQNNVDELAKYIQTNDLKVVFPEVLSLINLVLTLPITSSSGEQPLSALKRIKSYLENVQNQEELQSLALLSIEKSFLKKQMDNKEKFYTNVIEEFCRKSAMEEFKFKEFI